MLLPDFLIIGAMEAGTTTLYRDLMRHPSIFFPDDKEPGCLSHDHVLSNEGRTDYAALFAKARRNQCCGEASTNSTKLPNIQGVPRRAHSTIGPEVKIIYLLRNPIDRAISHHYHEYSRGTMPYGFADALASHPELIYYGKYAMQAEAWLEYFSQGNLHFIVFEEFIANRAVVIRECLSFLGIDPGDDMPFETDRAHNVSFGAPVLHQGLLRTIREHQYYRRYCRPWLPLDVRQRIRTTLLPKAPPKPPPPHANVLRQLHSELECDVNATAELLKRNEPVWDLESFVRRLG
jgi:hypothetical protein